MFAKNCRKRSLFEKVMVKIKRSSFFCLTVYIVMILGKGMTLICVMCTLQQEKVYFIDIMGVDEGMYIKYGPLSETALDILCELGRRITACSGDDREGFFLFQRLSVCMHRFNAVLLHDSVSMNQPD